MPHNYGHNRDRDIENLIVLIVFILPLLILVLSPHLLMILLSALETIIGLVVVIGLSVAFLIGIVNRVRRR